MLNGFFLNCKQMRSTLIKVKKIIVVFTNKCWLFKHNLDHWELCTGTLKGSDLGKYYSQLNSI